MTWWPVAGSSALDNQYLQGLSKQQRQKILGVCNNQQYEQGGDWQKLLPNWLGLGKQGSRLDEFILQHHAHKKLNANKDNATIRVDRVSLYAAPYAVTERVTRNGGIDRNYYDKDGRQYKQISNNDHGNPKRHPLGKHGEHAHDYVYTPEGACVRSGARDFDDDERKEVEDIL